MEEAVIDSGREVLPVDIVGDNQEESSDKPITFEIPEAYKEKGWAKNLKSQEDLWKTLDNAQSLIGKKSVVPEFDKMTPKEVEDYYAQLRPTDKNAYSFGDVVSEQEAAAYKELLYKHGISAKQGNELVSEYIAMQQEQLKPLYDETNFKNQLKEVFGSDYEKAAGFVATSIVKNIGEADKKLIDSMTNDQVVMVYKLVNNLVKNYGIKESDLGASKPSSPAAIDYEARNKELYNQLNTLSRRPHTQQEKKEILDEISRNLVSINSKKGS